MTKFFVKLAFVSFWMAIFSISSKRTLLSESSAVNSTYSPVIRTPWRSTSRVASAAMITATICSAKKAEAKTPLSAITFTVAMYI